MDAKFSTPLSENTSKVEHSSNPWLHRCGNGDWKDSSHITSPETDKTLKTRNERLDQFNLHTDEPSIASTINERVRLLLNGLVANNEINFSKVI